MKNSGRFTPIAAALPPQYISGQAMVERSLISNGCEIYGEVRNSVIGAGVTIGKGAVVRDSIIMQGVTIGKGLCDRQGDHRGGYGDRRSCDDRYRRRSSE